MHMTSDDLKRILLNMSIAPVSPADIDLMERIQEALDNSCEDDIPCPHCEGRGTVGDDFLTDEHVSDVFSDYCEIFGYHKAYGVEDWDNWGEYVHVKQDTSCRGCYDYVTHKLPKTYFTRNVAERQRLMLMDREAEKRKIEIEKAAKNKDKIAKLERELAELKGTSE